MIDSSYWLPIVCGLIAISFVLYCTFSPTNFHRYRWWRRYRGGHWEMRRHGSMGEYEFWMRTPSCRANAPRSVFQKGGVTCEDYPIKERT